ncbi:dihydroxyacetone kinase subunit DhaK [Blautia schinkii]|nr:dihydroxyacetone kinase subunit DhaK [Blautia schinkii]
MKKFINKPENVVTEMLEGFAAAHPNVIYSGKDTEVIYRRQMDPGKVGLVSGGGAGHEPAHAGYVGRGMLDAAVSGNVFASPSPDRILYALHKVDTGAGVLLIVKNYSGDVMNFQMAGELARREGISVESVIVRDDVAVEDSTYTTGRRGIAGTVFVHKISGGAAMKGKDLLEVKKIAEKAATNVRSMGMALSGCTLPGVGQKGFQLGEDELELGMGIHGEPGIYHGKITDVQNLVGKLMGYLMKDLDYTKSETAVMVNGLGGTPLMELYIVFWEVKKYLEGAGIGIYKAYVGNYMTSLEMAGCSVSLLKLDEELKTYLDMDTEVSIWK